MFPKIVAPGRSRLGTISGTISAIEEASTGKIYFSNTLVPVLVDDADTVQGEFFDGAVWTEDTDANINNMPYAVGVNVRYRIKNSYFGQNSSYITGTAGSVLDTGGAVAYGTVLSALGTPSIDNFSVSISAEINGQCIIPAGMVGKTIRMRVYTSGLFFSTSPTTQVDFDTYADVVAGSTTVAFGPLQPVTNTKSYFGTVNYQFYVVYPYPDGPVAEGNKVSDTYTI
jgi:hypothetical protein